MLGGTELGATHRADASLVQAPRPVQPRTCFATTAVACAAHAGDLRHQRHSGRNCIGLTHVLGASRLATRQAIKAVVQRGVEVLEDVTDKEERVKLITTLRTVSAGRVRAACSV